jgi:hypothetical protein
MTTTSWLFALRSTSAAVRQPVIWAKSSPALPLSAPLRSAYQAAGLACAKS